MNYRRKFYEATKINMTSAVEIVPHVVQLVSPSSVVDVGCGVGGWLAAFRDQGVKDFLGIDGKWVHLDDLLIAKDNFRRHDLSTPFNVERRFDLAISLEVAEHIPPASAPAFIDSLTRLSDVVLFSAAIPFQGGTNHFNEQWPPYWIEKFGALGFELFDVLRPRFWDHPTIRWWYAQNMLLFVRGSSVKRYPLLEAERTTGDFRGFPLVHPRRWEKQCDPKKVKLVNAVRQCGKVLAADVKGRLNPGSGR